MKNILFLSNLTSNLTTNKLAPNKSKILSAFISQFCFLACVFIIIAKADVNLIMEQDINFGSKKGTFGGKMSYKDQAWQAIGNFQVNAENKVRFQIDQVNVGGRFYNLKQKPVIVRQLKSPNAILRKGSNLVLKNENQAEFDEFYARVNDTAYVKQEEKAKQKRKARTLSSALSSGGADSGGGSTGMSIGTSSGNSSLPYYMPSTIGTTSNNGDGKITTYTTQFCKAPEYLHNAIKLSIVDKDGNCIDRLAVRDDTKCEYRFDFANSKAIKQTQFYYVDNENKVQVVGDCVDLQGAEYQSTLYKDDTRCSLESTDKNYGGGTASFFVTQILFRGIDGLIHKATDCMAYGNIKEELVKYEHNDKAKQSQRVVNQYYTDYYTGERVYITQGVKTDKAFDWKETTCGEWEHDDENLRSRIRTEIGFYDDVDYKQAKVTSCDYSTAKGKAGIYEIKYVVKDDVDKEIELRRESRNFSISKHQRVTDSCKAGAYERQNGSRYDYVANTSWTTTWKVIDKTSYIWYVRADGTEYQKLNDPTGKNEKFIEIRREERVSANGLGANEQWRKFYEFHSKQSPADYLAQEKKTIGESTDYVNWVNQKVGGNRTCAASLHSGHQIVRCGWTGKNWSENYPCAYWIPYSIP
ncbi:hypothetical protein [Helicobacter sp. T3_23-1056]